MDRNLNATELVSAIQKITSKPIQIVYDSIATADTQDTAYEILANGGRLLVSTPSVIDKAKIVPDKKVIFFSGKVCISEYSAIDEEFFGVYLLT